MARPAAAARLLVLAALAAAAACQAIRPSDIPASKDACRAAGFAFGFSAAQVGWFANPATREAAAAGAERLGSRRRRLAIGRGCPLQVVCG
jgi:hypothetical protein